MILRALTSRYRALSALTTLCATLSASSASGSPEVVVVYNSRVPESKEVAEYYAERRQVPKDQIIGLELPTGETMSRKEYLEQLHQPLLKKLEESKLLTFGPATNKPAGTPDNFVPFRKVLEARIRYAALCYGVPTKIAKDPTLVEPNTEKLQPEMQRNEAAVDTQLALLPISDQKIPWAGPLPNPFYNVTNAAQINTMNGLLMVTRLDGPSAKIAKGLVDKAMEAETNGLWGRGYFDARGLATNDSYRIGDDLIVAAAKSSKLFGFDTELDEKPATFTAGFPMAQVAVYAGWYDQTVTGPFTRPSVEFMPGAFAYHLYSFGAATIRTANRSWVGTLLEKGATCTMGAVDEPYLTLTPDINSFVSRFLHGGFSFGEAAYASQNCLSWQTTVIGDPLYRPWGRNLNVVMKDLESDTNKLVEWAHLMVVIRNEGMGSKPQELARYIEAQPIHRQSATLTEKLADYYWAKGSLGDAVDTYEVALRRGPTPQQRVRLLIKAAERRAVYGPDDRSYAHYNAVLTENPSYPDALKIYQAMLPVAKRMSNAAEMKRCQEEIARLTPPPAKP